MMKILLIGLGNVGTNLAKAIGKQTNIELSIYSKNAKETALFCQQNDLQMIQQPIDYGRFDLVLICVNDDSISRVVEVIPESTSVAYTAGAFDLDRLKRKNKGVFYPLQTFQKSHEVEFKSVPFFIEADQQNLEELLLALAFKLSDHVQTADSSYRKKLHVAAVFANNFTNFMLTQAHDFLKSQNIPFEHLLPLLEKTIDNAKRDTPRAAQTGPARRGDLQTIAQHKTQLTKEQAKIYRFISEEIQNYYEKL